jgi:abequosyltransferase
MIKISFAIPTYNFGEFLAETVHSIYKGAHQLSANEIEVVIVDGASSDNTQLVVAQLCEEYASIRYEPRLERGGIDFDMNLAASLCTGEYIWLLSADDLVCVDWDTVLLRHIDKFTPDVVLVPAWLCTLTMKPLRRSRVFDVAEDEDAQHFKLAGQTSVHNYLQKALTLEALFSYMSGVVIRKSTWASLQVRQDYYGSCWAHCARIIALLQRTDGQASILYLNRFLLRKRSGNDSFMENGLVKRLAITVDGWHRIAMDFFHDTKTRWLIGRLMYLDSSLLNFMYAKLGAKTNQEVVEVIRMGKVTYLSNYISLASRLKYIALIIAPHAPKLQQLIKGCIPRIAYLRHWIIGLVY